MITKEEFLKEFSKNRWDCQFTVNKFASNTDCGVVDFKPQDLLVQAEMFLTFSEIEFYLIYDDYFNLCVLDNNYEGGYHFEEFFPIYETKIENAKELKKLIETSAQQAVRKFWLEYIKAEYEKLKDKPDEKNNATD